MNAASGNNVKAFHYIKSPEYTEQFVTGVYGGIDLQSGRLYMATFAERGPIPQTVNVEFDPNGNVVSETPEGKDGIIRSVSSVMHYDINTAMALKSWLDQKINQFFEEHPELDRGGKV